MVLSQRIERWFTSYQKVVLPLNDESLQLAHVRRIELRRPLRQSGDLPLIDTCSWCQRSDSNRQSEDFKSSRSTACLTLAIGEQGGS